MNEASIVATLIVVAWFAFGWTRASNNIKKGERFREQARIETELAEKREKEEKEKRIAELQRTFEEQARAREEKERKELNRIEELRNDRPSLEHMRMDNKYTISDEDEDYLDLSIDCSGGELSFVYLTEEQNEMCDEDEDNFHEIILEEGWYTLAHYIGDVEAGTKRHFVKFNADDYDLGELDLPAFIRKELGEPDETITHIGIRFTHSKKHYMYGAVGLERDAEKPLAREDFVFQADHMYFRGQRINYDDLLGEMTGSWNTIYDEIFEIEELDDISLSDVWK